MDVPSSPRSAFRAITTALSGNVHSTQQCVGALAALGPVSVPAPAMEALHGHAKDLEAAADRIRRMLTGMGWSEPPLVVTPDANPYTWSPQRKGTSVTLTEGDCLASGYGNVMGAVAVGITGSFCVTFRRSVGGAKGASLRGGYYVGLADPKTFTNDSSQYDVCFYNVANP